MKTPIDVKLLQPGAQLGRERREGLVYPFLKIEKSALIFGEKNAQTVFIFGLNIPSKM